MVTQITTMNAIWSLSDDARAVIIRADASNVFILLDSIKGSELQKLNKLKWD
jgi:hypothetical protein